MSSAQKSSKCIVKWYKCKQFLAKMTQFGAQYTFFFKNVCMCQKKAVPLQSISIIGYNEETLSIIFE